MTMRTALAFSALALATAASAQIGGLSFIGSQSIPTNSLTYGGAKVGGLSGIDYDAATGNYYIQSDARIASDGAPYGRFFTARLDSLKTSGTFGANSVAFTGLTSLKTPGGDPFPAAGLDPESIRLHNGRFYVSSEGAATAAVAQNPFVRTYDATGTQVQELPLPDKFRASTDPNGTGVRNNLAFESLAFSPDGLSLYTATENALKQDGPLATVDNGSNSRILRYDLTTGLAAQEYVYHVEPVAAPSSVFTVNGLVELLSVDDHRLLALERSFSVGVGNSVKLYEIDLNGATDVSGIASVASLAGIAPVSKRLVYDFNTLFAPNALDNLEGMTFGPILPDGSRSLVFVSDDNFDATNTVGTQFLAFKVNPVPEPSTFAALGLGAVALFRRRRR